MAIAIPENIRPVVPEHLATLKTRMHQDKGALLFSDISGFTSMSETLAAIGKAGTEELTVLLTRYFDAMLQTTRDFQGNVLRFIGDALVVGFADQKKAAACAQTMMDKMTDFQKIETSSGMYALSMKIILAQGS